MKFTDEQLTEIYKAANNEVGKARPLTTMSIFSAMRAIAQLVERETLEGAAKHFDERGKYADGSWSVGWYDPESSEIILRALKAKGE